MYVTENKFMNIIYCLFFVDMNVYLMDKAYRVTSTSTAEQHENNRCYECARMQNCISQRM